MNRQGIIEALKSMSPDEANGVIKLMKMLGVNDSLEPDGDFGTEAEKAVDVLCDRLGIE